MTGIDAPHFRYDVGKRIAAPPFVEAPFPGCRALHAAAVLMPAVTGILHTVAALLHTIPAPLSAAAVIWRTAAVPLHACYANLACPPVCTAQQYK